MYVETFHVSGGAIYYTQNECLCKIKAANATPQEIAQIAAYDVVVDGSYTYSAGMNYLTRTPLDGSSGSSLVNPEEETGSIVISDGYVYYINTAENNSIYRISVDGKDRKAIYSKEPVKALNVSSGTVYFSKQNGSGGQYKLDMKTGAEKKIKDGKFNAISIAGDWVYYIGDYASGGTRYRIKSDGTRNGEL